MLAYSPFLPEVIEDPHPIYRRLRVEAPAYYLEEYDAWALSRFEDAWRATEDTETYSSTGGTTAAQTLSRVEPPVPSVNQLDPPDHTRLRQAIRGPFTRGRVAALEAEVRAFTRACLERRDAPGDEIDAVRELADPLAARVACRLLDLPEEDAPLLVDWVHRYTRSEPGDLGRSADALAAAREMNEYLADFVRRWRRAPGRPGAVVEAFLGFELGGRRLADLEIASHLQTLVIGGTDTTPKAIGAALVRLHEHPEQRAWLAASPARIPAAFTEVLRYDMPTQFMARTLRRDTELHGAKLRAGQGVLLLFASANRDEREFEDPDRFDVARNPRRILSFGHAAHVCLGAHVARLEGRVVLEEVLARFPDYEVDPPRLVRRRADQIQGLVSVPIQLRPARGPAARRGGSRMLRQPREIVYGGAVIGEEEIAAVVNVLRQGIQPGANVAAFERRVAALLGKRHGAMVNSGSSALLVAMRLLDAPAGSEVLTSVLTFSTDVAAIVHAGFVPAFVDCELDTYQIDVDAIERMIGPKTRALLVPDLVGGMPDWDRLEEIARRRDLVLIEDSCDTLGGAFRGRPAGERARISVTSFSPHHIITAMGTGGLVAVDEDALWDRALTLRGWGRSSEPFMYGTRRGQTDGRFLETLEGMDYDAMFIFRELGYGFIPSEAGAAFGLAQLDQLPDLARRRTSLFERHLAFVREHEDVFIAPRVLDGVVTTWLCFPVQLRPELGWSRKDFQMHLLDAGIQNRLIFSGNMTRQPMLRGVPHRVDPAGYPNADQIMRHGTMLPCHPTMTDDDCEYLYGTIEGFVARMR